MRSSVVAIVILFAVLPGVAAASRAAEEAAAAAAGHPKTPVETGKKRTLDGSAAEGEAPKKPAIPIGWRKHLEAARREAAERGLCTLVYFRADWCAPCRLMGNGTFLVPAVAQFINRRFVSVKVDDSDGKSEVAKAYKIRVYPSVLFLDPGGEPLHLVLGPREPERFYRILEQVSDLPRLMDRRHAHPDSLKANFALGNALAKLNHLHRAAPYLEKAADLDPKNEAGRRSQARLILAVVPLEDGQSEQALANLEAWLKAFPDAPEVPVAVWYQGTILYKDGKLAEAKRYFEAIVRRFRKHPKAYEADKAIAHIEARLRAEAQAGAAGDAAGQDQGKAASPATTVEDRPQPKG